MGSTSQNDDEITLELIAAASPTLVESIRICPLQAGLSRISALDEYVLGNPKAWLGTAYHEVLENLWTKYHELSDDGVIERLWSDAIQRLMMDASCHPLNSRFGTPQKWPGYNLARAFVQIRAEEALAEKPRSSEAPPQRPRGSAQREEKLWAMGGKLTGKPDLLLGDEIRDYKSGRIVETSADGQEVVKRAYINQLLLYGHLVHEATGRCPSKGALLPMQGQVVEVDLDPESCAAAASEAVDVLDQYNQRIETSSDVSVLATPSPTACRWCQYKTLCPAFWTHVKNDWAEELGTFAVSGVLTRDPETIHNGKATSIALSVVAGTSDEPEVVISPLDGTVHGSVLANLSNGNSVRIVNLFRRRDGTVAPTVATVCIRPEDCPRLSVGSSGSNT